METLENILNHGPWVLKFNTLLTLVFLALIALVICLLIFLRFFKNSREKKKIAFQNTADDFLNNYMFNNDFDIEKEIQYFKTKHLNSALHKKITIKQILIYNENFKGETSSALKQLFKNLGLDTFIFNTLQQGKWYDQARAIYILSELFVNKPQLVEPYLNAKHKEVREQAIYYFLKTAKDNPLSFFKNLTEELTLWELIYIEDSIKYVYEGKTPDFSEWLNHPLTSVVGFSIKMIQQFNQFEHTPRIIPFLRHKNPELRKLAIQALTNLQYHRILEEIIFTFSEENLEVKKEIINSVKTLGDIKQLERLKPHINEEKLELAYKQAEKELSIV